MDNRRDIDRGIAEALRYYGGPLGDKVISLAQVANTLNPVTGIESSMQAAGRAGDASLTASERLMSAVESAVDMGLALTPAFVARLARGAGATDDAAETVMDLLTGASPSTRVSPDQDTVGPEGLRLLHGTPRSDLTLDDIQIVREGAKQGRRGRKTGGFYTTSVDDAAQAEGYARMTGGQGRVMDVTVAPGTRILRFDGDITRLSEDQINNWTNQGYGLVIGKDVRGRTEYVVIDRDAIQSLSGAND